MNRKQFLICIFKANFDKCELCVALKQQLDMLYLNHQVFIQWGQNAWPLCPPLVFIMSFRRWTKLQHIQNRVVVHFISIFKLKQTCVEQVWTLCSSEQQLNMHFFQICIFQTDSQKNLLNHQNLVSLQQFFFFFFFSTVQKVQKGTSGHARGRSRYRS